MLSSKIKRGLIFWGNLIGALDIDQLGVHAKTDITDVHIKTNVLLNI